ncbi:MAG: hypothetical protein P4K98_14200 [Bryobacteraceae bacterium]|nr:hypothetical protein [Bryobacteraceae bacterium]
MPKATPNPVFRSTAVLTARNGKIRYFRSPDEVPADLQRDLDKALHGELTANVILADEGGQKYLQSRAEPAPPVAPKLNGQHWLIRRLALEAAGAAALAMALWILAAGR